MDFLISSGAIRIEFFLLIACLLFMLFYVVSEAAQRLLSLWAVVFSGGRKLDSTVKVAPVKKESITVDDLEPIVVQSPEDDTVKMNSNDSDEEIESDNYPDNDSDAKKDTDNDGESSINPALASKGGVQGSAEKGNTEKNSTQNQKIDSNEVVAATQSTSATAASSKTDTSDTVGVQSDEMTPILRAEVSEIAKLVRTKIARGEISDARSKIIEGLAIDKWNKELNCLLASLYERDNDYRKAEFVYKDLILVHDTDPEIYMKLGFSLSIQGKFEIAYEIYKKLLDLSESHSEAAEMLANIAHELGKHESAVEYSKVFLRKYPRNADILTILSASLIHLDRKEEALETLEKLKLLDPYNPRIREMKEKLELELELSKKFSTPSEE